MPSSPRTSISPPESSNKTSSPETTLKSKGEQITEKDEQALLSKITKRYEAQTKATYAASRLWYDAIIDPLDTRKWISIGIDMANHKEIEKFNVGVIQT